MDEGRVGFLHLFQDRRGIGGRVGIGIGGRYVWRRRRRRCTWDILRDPLEDVGGMVDESQGEDDEGKEGEAKDGEEEGPAFVEDHVASGPRAGRGRCRWGCITCVREKGQS